MKNTINPMKAIAIIAIVSVVIVGGYILGQSIFAPNSAYNADMAAAVSPSTSLVSTYDNKDDSLPDGTTDDVDSETQTPTPSDKPEDIGTPTSIAPVNTTSPSTNTSTSPTATPVPDSTNESGQVYVPGFGYVTGGGESTVIEDDSIYENGNKVGTMG